LMVVAVFTGGVGTVLTWRHGDGGYKISS
jgi:hypothetical protein